MPNDQVQPPRRNTGDGAQPPRRRVSSDTARTSGTQTPQRRTAASGEQPRRAPGAAARQPGTAGQPRRRPPEDAARRRPADGTPVRNPRRRRRRRRNNNRLILIGTAVLLILLIVFTLSRCAKSSDKAAAPTLPEETEPEIVHQVSTATITATGDVLMHLPVIATGLQSDGSYNFDSIFRYISGYTSQADYAAANLETTLCGSNNGYKYSGYPCFNCPDAIVDGLKGAGFDMLLTANNHSYDTGALGYSRTIEIVRGRGLENLGTMASPEEPKFLIKNLNGIKVGMLCYTYEQPVDDPQPGIVYLNFIPMAAGGNEIINSFLPSDTAPFYAEVADYIQQMKQAGAEAIVMFIHWGIEYETAQNAQQRDIAQRLCDLGVDVIIGGHPHVVQPVQMLTSNTDENHKTLCLYSMGNAVSNQRKEQMTSIQTGHTEDGVLFSVTFSKYSDGTVYLDSTDIIPTWVKMSGAADSPSAYNILPLDDSAKDQWQSRYNLDEAGLAAAEQSYDRTMAIVGDGMELSQNYLRQAKLDRDSAYAGITEEPTEAEAADAA